MKLITWNIQWGLGVDGRVDLARIVDTARGILTGDFNCAPSDDAIARLQAPMAVDVPAYADACGVAHPGSAHASPVGRYDKMQRHGGERCFDSVFITADIARRVRRVEVNQETAASDHQPVLLEIDL